MRTDKELLDHIDRVIWDDVGPDEKVLCIQNLLYQRAQVLDHKTEQMFGSDQRPLDDEPNMRRI